MKDNFSEGSDRYAKYRPAYPDELFSFIKETTGESDCAWDCGTGNGQIASKLVSFTKHIYATDISAAQIAQAIPDPSVTYSIGSAEQAEFSDNFFDYIVVGQAAHWFNFELFYKEVFRVLKPGGWLFIAGYNRPKVNMCTDNIVNHLYTDILGKFWDAERKYIDEEYKTIPFPLDEIETPSIQLNVMRTADEFTGYLETWSALKHYIKATGINPIETIGPEIRKCFTNSPQMVTFPLLLRAGRKPE